MSKETIRASIRSKRAEVAGIRSEIAALRSKKRETSARYSANIKNASSTATKNSYRNQKATAIAYIEGVIRTKQSRIASIQRDIASLTERLKYTN